MNNSILVTGSAENVLLGAVTMTVEQFSLDLKRPSVCHTLCDGSQKISYLGEMPCTVLLGGRILPDDCGSLPAKLRSLLSGNAVFSFSCRGCSFSGMRITALHCETNQNRYDAALSVTLCGTMCGEVPT